MQFDKDLHSVHKHLFLNAREFLLSFDGVEETKKERITTYGNKHGGLCHLRTMPHGIDVGFLKGAKMTDEKGGLTGKGKAIRVLSMTEFDQDILCYYFNQALDLNQTLKSSSQ